MITAELPDAEWGRGTGRRQWLWFAGPSIFAAVLTWVYATPPGGGDFLLFLAAFCAWAFAGVWWLAQLAIPKTRVAKLLMLGPAVFALTIGLIAADVPLRLTFLASQPALNAYADSFPGHDADPESVPVGRFVGLFSIDSAYRESGDVYLLVNGAGFMLEQCMFVRTAGGHVLDPQLFEPEHLTGDWYMVCED
ncbi:hypothetical protein Pth03_30730 [Planotetraspora thailandica]|uniref:Uncharacterized protein n=1 Tax=Planotetraspora thailandica TaxID=487172 RepID=A0A8J3UZ01_9ACTN|nr:hypothetical protein [Planotetraspora thailandica]GII54684.1 hypothetical protein Pth03_30730 [Planotetraspora thailandica]